MREKPGSNKWYLDGAYAGDDAHRRYLERLEPRARALRGEAIRRLVDSMLQPRTAYPDDEYWLLALCGGRALPALVGALEDDRFLTPQALEYEGPFQRVRGLIEPLAPEEAVAPLARLLKHVHPEVRRQAALCLGALGLPSCAAPLRKALRSDDHWLRSSALIGIELSLRGRRASRGLLGPLFDDVAAVVDLPSVGGTDAPGVLLRMDRDGAVAFLVDPARFRAGHAEIASIVKGLAEARVRLRGASVAALLEDVERGVKAKAPGSVTTFGYGLQLLALSGDAAAGGRIERAMKSGDEYLRGLAADASKILEGVPDAYAVAMKAWAEAGDVAELPDPVRHYVAVNVLRNEVGNGSFEQYFFNSYSEDVAHAIEGLEAVGAKKSAAIVRRAVALFGKAGPSKDRSTRQRQLEAVDAGALVRLSEELLKDPDRLRVLLASYAAKHREYFVRGSVRR